MPAVVQQKRQSGPGRPVDPTAASLGRWARFRVRYLERSPSIIATVAMLLGLLTLLDAVWPDELFRVGFLVRILPVPGNAAATAVVACAGLVLLRVAAGLRKRKRLAWRVAVVATVVLTVGHVLKGRRVGEALFVLILLVLLITARSRFTAKSDPATRWVAVKIFFQFFAVAIVYGMAMLYFYPRMVVGDPSFWQRLQEVLYGLVGVDGEVKLKSERFDDIFHYTLFGFALLTVVLVLILALRPSEHISRLSADDEQRLRDLLEKQGYRDSLGYFALRRDKSVLWSPTGKAAITYRVVQGVALASGDPIGDPEAWPGAIAAYREMVESYAWTPAVVGCSELGAIVFRREYGLAAIELGDEAIVDVAEFSLDGRAMRGVRQACTRVARSGYEVQVRRAKDIDPVEFRELLAVADAWRGAKTERGFSMALSRLGDPSDPECVVTTAHSEGVLRGMLNFAPWGQDGLSLDLMRRDRTADNGLNEYMITHLIQAGPQLGVRRVSLNFAVFRDAIERGEKIGAGPILRAWRSVLMFASRWWQIESLYRFNVKFRPDWEPRFLSFPATRDLPRIVIAALEAEAFLVRPHFIGRLFGRS
ncbi:lysyl-tRNA synthetase class 2 [Jatrophihabitans sp. GAS493]|uniref:phosphatidylglycerol lysyltransferase domain-containing protein n=1 Tax=Jatrophihabitans sp. GAS493 TaxID=1907575 RepID=UPI000BBF566A|nr:phosphatidylglycerol lysyltransferase domain-containing protein [Jatrophihabitans sp. GAS493]SOD70792.1 lysyl-tRNA synthetase class 2 [Jatrophihabitans sp. GAS493]